MLPKIEELFDLSHSLAGEYLRGFSLAWEALPGIKGFIAALGPTLPKEEYEEVSPHVWVARSAKVMPTAYLGEYTVIGPETEVRHCSFIRGAALVGAGVVVGNSTEMKNAIVFDGVQIPHYNYVGDSVLGYRSHLGAGSIASNFRSDKGNITVHAGDENFETGLRKMGVLLGDFAEIGCNSVLCPGAVVGRRAIAYPLSRVRGYLPADTILKGDGSTVKRV